jgi:hypothetical protein
MTQEAATPAAEANPPAQADQPKTEEQLWSELQSAKSSKEVEAPEPKPSASAAADQTDEGKDKGAGETQKTSAAKSELDIWANATPEQRAAYQAAQQKARSNSGRISALQRKINALQTGAPKQGEAPRSKAREIIAPLKDDYPDIAAPLDQLAGRVDDREAQETAAREEELAAAKTELDAEVAANEAALAVVHPDWTSMFEGPEGQKLHGQYIKWVNEIAPNRLFNIAVQNKDVILSAEGAIEVLDRFKEYIRGHQPQAAQTQPPPQRQPAPQPKLDDKRQRQLAATAAPSAGSVARTSPSNELPPVGDGEAMWAQLQADKRAKQAAQARR